MKIDFTSTNPLYGRDDSPAQDTAWYIKHDDVPNELKCVCLYPIVTHDRPVRDDDFVMPDLGKGDLAKLPKERKDVMDYLVAKYGADNMVSLAMGEWAEQHGYKPVEQAQTDIDLTVKRDILIADFEKDYDRAMDKWGHLIDNDENSDITDDFVRENDNEYKPSYPTL